MTFCEEMKTGTEKKEAKVSDGGPGIGFLILGISFIIMVCLGYTIIPEQRYGWDRPLETWQMWGIGILLIAMSIGGVIRQYRAAKNALILKATLKSSSEWKDVE